MTSRFQPWTMLVVDDATDERAVTCRVIGTRYAMIEAVSGKEDG